MKKHFIHKLYNALDRRPVVFLIALSFTLNCFIELIGRRSVTSLMDHIIQKPHFFLMNTAIIMCTFIIALPMVRRAFTVVLVTSFWMVCGITNCVIISLRASPFTARDIFLVGYGLRIADVYLSKPAIILIAAVIVLLITGAVIAYKKLPRRRSRPKLMYVLGGATLLIIGLALFINIVSKEVKAKTDNVQGAYDEFGFTYCFTISLLSSGIDRPEDYSADSIAGIMSEFDNTVPDTPQRANIVFVQLESFFDPSDIIGLRLSKNPIRFFTSLKEEYPSGYLHVPVVGGGTANTEFEVLTGMSARHFALGEFPYESVLRERGCESIAYNLKELGYSASAIHNHNGAFYSRDTVFSNLGFDRFISLEYMQNVEYTQTGWAKDNVLTDYVTACLNSSDSPDIVFTVTVQGHGKYPEDFGVSDFNTPEFQEPGDLSSGAFEYYLALLGETDEFISDLVEALDDFGEDVVLVLYGDHLPALPITEEQLESGSQYMTEYVIWSNFPIDAEDTDLYSYELSSYVLDLLGIDEGVITKLHQSDGYMRDADDALIMLEYDMLYGESYMNGGEDMFTPSELHMGIDDITIHDAYSDGLGSYVRGSCFTPFSVVYINGRRIETEYVSPELLQIQEALVDGDSITVCQSGPDRAVLSSTEEYMHISSAAHLLTEHMTGLATVQQ